MASKSIGNEILDDSVENFAGSVKSEFLKLKKKASKNIETRVKKFIDSGTQALLKKFDKSSWMTKGLVTAGVGALAFSGMKILKRGIDGLFGIGHWVLEKVGLTRKKTLKTILKIILGVGAIALLPLLYQGIKGGMFKISDITKIWKSGGVLGIFNLLTSKFPESLKNLPEDILNFLKKSLGAEVLSDGLDKAKEKVKKGKEKMEGLKNKTKDIFGQTSDSKEGNKDKKTGTEKFVVEGKKIKKALENEGVKNTMERLIHDNATLVIKNGVLLVIKETGELLDLSRWLSLQWVDSIDDVKKEILKNPEHWFGALVTQYLGESTKFIVVATGIDFLSSLVDRGKVISPLKSIIAGTQSGLKWGAWPFKIVSKTVGKYKELAARNPMYFRMAKGGVEFLGKGGKEIAKISAKTGKLVFWEGGKWVAVKTVEKIGGKVVLEGMGKAISHKYKETIGKRVIQLGEKEMMTTVLKALGWRGAAITGLFADDATVIGVLDDILAVGLGVWLSYDVYYLVQRYRNILRFNELKKSQDLLGIKSVKILDQPTQDSFDIKIKSLGKKEEDLSPEDFRNILDSLPLVRFKVIKEDDSEEIYTLKRGDIVNVSIQNKNGKVLEELSNEDVEAAFKTIPAPTKFSSWEIDYKNPSQILKSNFRTALRYVKNETGWQQLKMDIIDTKTVRIYRSDTGTESYLTRDKEDKWHISEYPTMGFDFFQALSMANLNNRVNDIVKGYWIKGDENPFYQEDGDIYYGRTGNDVKILSGKEKSWKKFFNNMKVSDQDLIDLLNHFHDEKNKK